MPEAEAVVSIEELEFELPGAAPVTETAVPASVTEPEPDNDDELIPPVKESVDVESRSTFEEAPLEELDVTEPFKARGPKETSATGCVFPDTRPVAEPAVSRPPLTSGATKVRLAVENISEPTATGVVMARREDAGRLPLLAGAVLSSNAGCANGVTERV